MKFFRTSPSTYTAARAHLDGVWQHPKAAIHEDTGETVLTTSCLPSVEQAVKDDHGRVLVPLNEDQAEWATVAPLIANLVAQGAVEEVAEVEYREALPVYTLP